MAAGAQVINFIVYFGALFAIFLITDGNAIILAFAAVTVSTNVFGAIAFLCTMGFFGLNECGLCVFTLMFTAATAATSKYRFITF